MALRKVLAGTVIATALLTLAYAPAGAQDAVADAVAGADAAAGETTAFQCIGCHSFGEGEAARVGPNLFGIVDRTIGAAEGFNYSEALAALNAEGATWTLDTLNAFLANPQDVAPGTTMPFALRNEADRYNVLAYLLTLSAE
jgi:cytochrome c